MSKNTIASSAPNSKTSTARIAEKTQSTDARGVLHLARDAHDPPLAGAADRLESALIQMVYLQRFMAKLGRAVADCAAFGSPEDGKEIAETYGYAMSTLSMIEKSIDEVAGLVERAQTTSH